MLSYEQASQYIEDNNDTKYEDCEDKYCHKCNKVTEFYETVTHTPTDIWYEEECKVCGTEWQEFKNQEDYLEYKKESK